MTTAKNAVASTLSCEMAVNTDALMRSSAGYEMRFTTR
jgi:hypothetical protein